MPFGLKNSQATFQRAIDNKVLNAGNYCVQAYVNNILIFSETLKDHVSTLEAVLAEILAHNISLRPDKCEIAGKN